jgi:hypothetical protein
MLTVLVRGMVGCALLGFASCAYSGLGELHTLTCARSSGLCILEHETRLASTVRIPVADLTGAEVEKYRTAYPTARGGRRSTAERLVLLTKGGRVPFMDEYTDIGRDDMAAQKAEVDGFVTHPNRPRLRIQRDERRLAALVGGVPFLLGLGCLASAVVQYRRWRDA